MADKNEKNTKTKRNALQKFGAFFVRLAKRLKSFLINLKSELKRVVWPDRKRLIQSTATVLAICVLVSVILFVVDTVLRQSLDAVGFYDTSGTTATTATSATTSSDTTITTASGETTVITPAATTSAG